ncbi:MAG: hypothetical protein C4547_05965 [Phycisphaerales bacterium]|nr:MAG: hypothetical protein C4547_05965 [Phycisphaerales bacterium]
MLNGATGNICANEFKGIHSAPGNCADLAEHFDHSDPAVVRPGMVMVIDAANAGHLTVSMRAYDTKVAGIVSGAGGLQAGMVLGGSDSEGDDLPVALTGRVYCYVDATEEPIEVGDLLTTSNTPGHAMKVTDFARSQGCVLGKAMQPIEKGKKGLILVLVALQ